MIGFAGGFLLDVKGKRPEFLVRGGRIMPGSHMEAEARESAARQLSAVKQASGGYPILWVSYGKEQSAAYDNFISENNISGIYVVHRSMSMDGTYD